MENIFKKSDHQNKMKEYFSNSRLSSISMNQVPYFHFLIGFLSNDINNRQDSQNIVTILKICRTLCYQLKLMSQAQFDQTMIFFHQYPQAIRDPQTITALEWILNLKLGQQKIQERLNNIFNHFKKQNKGVNTQKSIIDNSLNKESLRKKQEDKLNQGSKLNLTQNTQPLIKQKEKPVQAQNISKLNQENKPVQAQNLYKSKQKIKLTDGMSCCPNPVCGHPFKSQNQHFKCQACKKQYCLICKTSWNHKPFKSCRQAIQLQFRFRKIFQDKSIINQEMNTYNILQGEYKRRNEKNGHNFMACPKCHKWNEKNNKSDLMKCYSCKEQFCVKCGRTQKPCQCVFKKGEEGQRVQSIKKVTEEQKKMQKQQIRNRHQNGFLNSVNSVFSSIKKIFTPSRPAAKSNPAIIQNSILTPQQKF